MKVSTAKPNSQRIYEEGEGIIIFYCGPCQNEYDCMEYGRNILSHMNYPRDRFYYKSDIPHLIDWSKQYRHMYYIDTYEFYNSAPADNYNQEGEIYNQETDTYNTNDDQGYYSQDTQSPKEEQQNYLYSQPTASKYKSKLSMSNRVESAFSESPNPYSLFDGPDPYKQTSITKKPTAQTIQLNSSTNQYKNSGDLPSQAYQASTKANNTNLVDRTKSFLSLFDGPDPYKQTPIVKKQIVSASQRNTKPTTSINQKSNYQVLFSDRSSSAVPFYDNDYSKKSTAIPETLSTKKSTDANLKAKPSRNINDLYESADPYSKTDDSTSKPVYRIVGKIDRSTSAVQLNEPYTQTSKLSRSASYQTYKPARSETPISPYSQFQPEPTNYNPYFQPESEWNHNENVGADFNNQYRSQDDYGYSQGYGNDESIHGNNNYSDDIYNKKNSYDYSFERSFNSGVERNGYENQYGYK